MTGGEQMTELGALTVLGAFIVLVALCSAAYWLLDRAGWLTDPDPWPEWERSPGGRNDRRALLEDEVR